MDEILAEVRRLRHENYVENGNAPGQMLSPPSGLNTYPKLLGGLGLRRRYPTQDSARAGGVSGGWSSERASMSQSRRQ